MAVMCRTLTLTEAAGMSSYGLTIQEAARQLNVSERTVHRYLSKGFLEAKKIDGKIYIPEESARHFDRAKTDIIDTNMTAFDPMQHVILSRQEYQGILTRLSQLEAERIYLIEHKETSSAQTQELKNKEAEVVRLHEALKFARLPWWKRMFGKSA